MWTVIILFLLTSAVHSISDRLIREHDNVSYTMASNTFSSMEWDTFQATYLGLKHIAAPPKRMQNEDLPQRGIPVALDWRLSNRVNRIQDQGNCGSCWAFATMCTIESTYAIRTGVLVKLNEQQLLDCSRNRRGCRGGYLVNSFQFARSKGLSTSYPNPYSARDNYTCFRSPWNVKVSRYVIGSGESFILNALQKGVVTVAFGVDQPFVLYKNGTYTGSCAMTPNHAMNIIGYDAQTWIVRNSWGAQWGEDGYVRIPRGQNKCRINDYVVSVVV